MRRSTLAWAAFGVAGVLAAISVIRKPHEVAPKLERRPSSVADLIRRESGADRKSAETKLTDYVERNSKNPNPKIQDEVGRARLHLGYLAANRQDFKAARATFETAAREYKGTGVVSEDFGGVPDQAAYQAAVCLSAEGKTKEYEHELRSFMKDRPLSPLVHAAFRRLQRLPGGATEGDEALLQTAIAKQQQLVRFETSVCGPKALAHLLPLLGMPARDYHEIAKLCGTDEKGTSMEGMRKGMRALGLDAHGYEVNRVDFGRLKSPFLMLQDDHYLVVTYLLGNRVGFFDPRSNSEGKFELPAEDDIRFRRLVLTTAPFHAGENR